MHFFLGDGGGFAETNDAGNVERTGAHTALVATAVHLAGHLYPWVLAVYEECTDTFGAVHLVARPGHEVNTNLLGVNRNLAYRLGSIRHEEYTVLGANFTDFFHRLNHPGFVVGPHDGDEDRLIGDGRFEGFEADEAFAVYFQVGYFTTLLFYLFTGIEHGFVLRCCGDDVVAFAGVHLKDAFDGEVVRLRSAGSKDDLTGVYVDEVS